MQISRFLLYPREKTELKYRESRRTVGLGHSY